MRRSESQKVQTSTLSASFASLCFPLFVCRFFAFFSPLVFVFFVLHVAPRPRSRRPQSAAAAPHGPSQRDAQSWRRRRKRDNEQSLPRQTGKQARRGTSQPPPPLLPLLQHPQDTQVPHPLSLGLPLSRHRTPFLTPFAQQQQQPGAPRRRSARLPQQIHDPRLPFPDHVRLPSSCLCLVPALCPAPLPFSSLLSGSLRNQRVWPSSSTRL